jgi:pteridine reductase
MNPSETTAIVTGGAVRIGRAIARRLARAGMNVAVHYGHSRQAAEETVAELERLGVRAVAIQADLRQPVAAADTILQQAAALGPVRVLVNNAAIFEPGRLLDTDEDHWDRHLAINLKAPFFLTREFVRHLGPEQEGAVVNIADWRGTRPVPGHAAYTQSKAALVAQTQLLARELGPRVRVNGVAPGAILPAPGDSDAEFQARAQANPLHRSGNPDDIADAVLFLIQSPFITGEIIHVTGGEHL